MFAIALSMLTLGLITSIHCVSMCGPMVVTYAVKGEEGGPWYRKLVPNLAYQGAKIVSYVLVGLLLGAIGSAFNLDGVRPYIMLVAGAFMIIMGLGMTGKVPWAARLTPRPPKFLMQALSKARRKANAEAEAGDSSLATPVTFGLLTGLMPCAPLMAAQLAAAGTGSVLGGGVAMLAFGIGTAPLMLAFGTASSLLPKDLKNKLMSVLAIVVIVFGGVYLNRAATRLGSPVTFNTVKQAVLGGAPVSAEPASYKTGADGVTEVPLVIQNVRFEPGNLQIPADKPVRLIVDRREENACSAQLSIPQLGVNVDLKPNGITTVDVPASKAGSYTLTCGMGMMAGTLLVGTPAVASSGGGARLPWLVLTIAAAGAALQVSRGIGGAPANNAPRRPAPAPAPAPALASSRRSGAQAARTGSRNAQTRGNARPAPAGAQVVLAGFTLKELLVSGGLIAAAIVFGFVMGSGPTV